MRRETPHPAITDYRLCKEFGWTIEEVDRAPGKKIQEFLVIMNEIDRKTKEEFDKAKKEAARGRSR
jgi:hypothetical protein